MASLGTKGKTLELDVLKKQEPASPVGTRPSAPAASVCVFTGNLRMESSVLNWRRQAAPKPSLEVYRGSCVSKLTASSDQRLKFGQD